MQLSVALQGIMTQQLLPTADGSVAASSAARCSSRPRPCATSSARARRTRSPPRCRPASNVGMQTMDSALAQLVRAGKITRRLAEERAHVPEELRRLLGAETLGVAA